MSYVKRHHDENEIPRFAEAGAYGKTLAILLDNQEPAPIPTLENRPAGKAAGGGAGLS